MSNIDEVLSINPSAVFLETLRSIIRTGLPILVELVDQVNSYNFSISNNLTQVVNFPTHIPDCYSHSPALLNVFISSEASICSTAAFPPLGNSNHAVVPVSIGFPSYSQWDALFHCIASDYSHADWDSLRDHLKGVPWEDIFKLVLLLLLVNFVTGFRLELMYISLIKSIRSSLSHLHAFQLLVLLPYSIVHRNHFLRLYQKDKSFNCKVKFRQASNPYKRVLEAAKLVYASKTKDSHFPETWL